VGGKEEERETRIRFNISINMHAIIPLICKGVATTRWFLEELVFGL
jgi:hypothetical protein